MSKKTNKGLVVYISIAVVGIIVSAIAYTVYFGVSARFGNIAIIVTLLAMCVAALVLYRRKR